MSAEYLDNGDGTYVDSEGNVLKQGMGADTNLYDQFGNVRGKIHYGVTGGKSIELFHSSTNGNQIGSETSQALSSRSTTPRKPNFTQVLLIWVMLAIVVGALWGLQTIANAGAPMWLLGTAAIVGLLCVLALIDFAVTRKIRFGPNNAWSASVALWAAGAGLAVTSSAGIVIGAVAAVVAEFGRWWLDRR